MIDRQRVAEGMKSLISDGLDKLNATTSNLLSLIALIAVGLVFIGAFLLPNSHSDLVSTKSYPPKINQKSEWNDETPIPISDRVRNKIFSSDSKKTTNESSDHLDWVSIEEFRMAYSTAVETSRIANYTGYALIIAIFGLMLTTIGIIFIRKTLIATEKANKEAAKMAIAAIRANDIAKQASSLQLQAWLDVGEPSLSYMGENMDHPNIEDPNAAPIPSGIFLFHTSISIINEGSTPVTSMEIRITKTVAEYSGGTERTVFDSIRNIDFTISNPVNPKRTMTRNIPMQLRLIQGNKRTVAHEKPRVHIEYSVAFKDSFTDEGKYRFFSVEAISKARFTGFEPTPYIELKVSQERTEVDGTNGFY